MISVQNSCSIVMLWILLMYAADLDLIRAPHVCWSEKRPTAPTFGSSCTNPFNMYLNPHLDFFTVLKRMLCEE
jgi:hypothetical protein